MTGVYGEQQKSIAHGNLAKEFYAASPWLLRAAVALYLPP